MRGAYCLVLEVLRDCEIRVGALGKLPFQKGLYVYIGSARNNLEKRIERHFGREKPLRWHIDYLTTSPNVLVKKAYLRESDRKEECEIAAFVAKHGTPVNGFGCSDCQCKSHFFKVNDDKFLAEIMASF